jgi:hypothetical protein
MTFNHNLIITIALSISAIALMCFSVIQIDHTMANHALTKSIKDHEALYITTNDGSNTSLPSFSINELRPHWLESPHNINLVAKQLEWMQFYSPNLNTQIYRVLLLEQSIRMRPTWANAYFELHRALEGQSSALGEPETILTLGSQFGPYDPSINFLLIEKQLEQWPTMTIDARIVLLERLLALLNAYYTHDELSLLIANSDEITRICSATRFFGIWIPECYP